MNTAEIARLSRNAPTEGPPDGERLWRDIVNALPAAIYTTDAEGRITYFNDAAVELSGRRPEIGSDRWCVTWKLYWPDGTPMPHDQCPMALTLKEGRSVRGMEAIAERPDGTRVTFVPYPSPLFDSSGKLIGAVNMLVDVTQSRRDDEGRQLLAAIVESSDDAIVSKNLDGIITSWNRGAERLFGYTAEEAIGMPVLMLIPPDHHGEEAEILGRIRRGQRVDHFETVRRRKHGSLITVSLTVSPIRNAGGKIVGASKIARDITRQKQDEERIQMLAREVDHRANNLLATVQAILRLTQADGLDEYRRAVQGRITALAQAHKFVVEGRPEGIDVRRLVTQELAPYGNAEGTRVQFSGPEITVSARVAQGLAMIFHELATNSAKYGALSIPSGSVAIAWTYTLAGDLAIRWTESGGPPVSMPARRGFGTGLIEAIVSDDLAGELSLDWQPTGLVCAFGASRERVTRG